MKIISIAQVRRDLAIIRERRLGRRATWTRAKSRARALRQARETAARARSALRVIEARPDTWALTRLRVRLAVRDGAPIVALPSAMRDTLPTQPTKVL